MYIITKTTKSTKLNKYKNTYVAVPVHVGLTMMRYKNYTKCRKKVQWNL